MTPDCYLGIETSGIETGAALIRDSSLVAERLERSESDHNERLLPMLDGLLEAAGVSLDDIAGIGVTIGPGRFTSLRVGLSTVKGLALARQIPVKGIGTLRALADTVARPDCPVLALVDARKQQVYAAVFLGEQALMEPALMNPADVGPAVSGLAAGRQSLLLAGSGAELCVPGLHAAGTGFEGSGIDGPSARAVALRAATVLATGDYDDLELLEPLYLRRTDAELNRERQRSGGGV
jgi:tRNA threonylcarbamoyladenosine biosynthesis protein TsaB